MAERYGMFALAILLPILITLASLNFHAYNERFYMNEFEKNNVYDELGKEDVIENYGLLIGYFKGDNGLENSFFNERERAHLIDVKNLLGYARHAFYAILALCAVIILHLIKKRDFHSLKKGITLGALLIILLLTLLGLFAIFDFSGLFLKFHMAFFSNDLWQLNPETDKLIMMFPEKFFFDSVVSIIVNCAIGIIFLLLAAIAINRLILKKRFS